MLAKLVPELEAFLKILIAVVLLFGAGYGIATWQSRSQLDALQSTLATRDEQLLANWQTTHNEITSMQKLLASQDEELRALASRKPDYIVKTTTVLAGETITTPILPATHTYFLADKIPVADFSQQDGQYTFTTHSLEFATDVVVSRKETLTNLYVTSDKDGVRHQLPHTVSVTKIDDWKPISPQLQLSGTITYPVDAGISLQAPIIHLSRTTDILVPRVFVGQQFGVGLDLVNYNLGSPIPVLQDTWIAGGIQTNLQQPFIGLSIGTKL